jgi:alcohol dehydrogenase
MNENAPPGLHEWPRALSTYRADEGLRGIVQGVGCVRRQLGAQLEAQDIRRPLLVCGEHVQRSPAFAIVHDAIASGFSNAPLVFTGSRPHSPSDAIERGARLARDNGVDGFVAVGGSSSIDSAKGMAVLLATGIEHVAELAPPSLGGLSAAHDTPRGVSRIPVLTATTTLSYAEFFPFWGTRRADTGAKAGYGDSGAVSRTIFLDGELATTTPDTVWFETAVKSLDDALLVYLRSGGPEPYLDPLLLDGIRAVVHELPSSRVDASGVAASRQRVLTAMALTKFPAPRTQPGFASEWFARAVRYALGSLYGASHGVGTCIALTQGLCFHSAHTTARQATLAEALGLRAAGGAGGEVAATDLLVECFDELLASLGLPRSLDELGVTRMQLDEIVSYITETMPGLGTRAAVRAAVGSLHS